MVKKRGNNEEVKNQVLGLDIGGSGCKAAIVDITTGAFLTERFRLETPQPSTPKAVAQTVKKIINHFDWKGRVGVGFPAIIKKGVAHSAANIHKDWYLTNVEKVLSKAIDLPVKVTNDADAAGIAALRFGAGKGKKGVVLFLTIGTGIGSALFLDGQLLPNSEFGHVFFKKDIAEKYAANSIRKRDELSYKQWGKRWNEYLKHLERIANPDLVILGGGGGKKFNQFSEFIKVDTKVIPATLQNNAGIIGAAMYAHENIKAVGV